MQDRRRMIIAIASDDGIGVEESPDRCCGFVIFEIGASGAARVGYRSACAPNGEPRGRAGLPEALDVSQPLSLVLSDCDAVVSRRVDDLLQRELQINGIQAYACSECGVDQAAQLFARAHPQRL